MTPEFGDLPPDGRAPKWVARLAPLKERPGEWARIPHPEEPEKRWGRGTASDIERGNYRGVVPGEFQAASRNCSLVTDRCDLWVRYVGVDR